MTAQPDQAWLGTVQGRVALVTGGTRGIGAAICQRLASDGAEIAAGYWRGRESAEKFAETMAAEYPGRRITVHEGNIGEAADCRRVLREVIDQHGRLDILVNNAGITMDRTVAKMTDEDWHRVIASISNFADVGDVTTLANPEIVEDIRHHVQSVKVARDDVPRGLTEAEFEEIKKFGG